MLNPAYPKIPDNVLKGTTTVGVVCKDGIVFGTDTRATMGYFVAHKKAKKVYKIDDHMAMTIAGAVADAQNMIDVLRANAQLYKLDHGRPMPVGVAARLLANILFSSRYAPLYLQALIGGIDSSGSSIYSVDLLGSVTEEKCVSTGSGSPVAYGVLESSIKEGMSVKETMPIVVSAVSSAMKRDSGSGDSFDVAVVTTKGYKELSDDEKKTIAPSKK